MQGVLTYFVFILATGIEIKFHIQESEILRKGTETTSETGKYPGPGVRTFLCHFCYVKCNFTFLHTFSLINDLSTKPQSQKTSGFSDFSPLQLDICSPAR